MGVRHHRQPLCRRRPWRLLLDAASRDIMVAVVLDRVPPAAEAEVSADLQSMLSREGLGGAQLFVVPEAALDGMGMLPPAAVEPLRVWVRDLAADAAGRADIARRTLNGTVKALGSRVEAVAQAAGEQERAAEALAGDARDAYRDAVARILEATRDGTLLRGEVFARWQDFVGTGEFFRAMERNIGRLRDRMVRFSPANQTPRCGWRRRSNRACRPSSSMRRQRGGRSGPALAADPAGRRLLGGDNLSGTSDGFAERLRPRSGHGRGPAGTDPEGGPGQAPQPGGCPSASTASARP